MSSVFLWVGGRKNVIIFYLIGMRTKVFVFFSWEFLTFLNIDLDGYGIVRTEKGQLRLKYIFKKCETNTYFIYSLQGRIQEFVQGGLNFFFFPGGAQHPLGHEKPLKSIDFTGPGGGLVPIAPLWNTFDPVQPSSTPNLNMPLTLRVT